MPTSSNMLYILLEYGTKTNFGRNAKHESMFNISYSMYTTIHYPRTGVLVRNIILAKNYSEIHLSISKIAISYSFCWNWIGWVTRYQALWHYSCAICVARSMLSLYEIKSIYHHLEVMISVMWMKVIFIIYIALRAYLWAGILDML